MGKIVKPTNRKVTKNYRYMGVKKFGYEIFFFFEHYNDVHMYIKH